MRTFTELCQNPKLDELYGLLRDFQNKNCVPFLDYLEVLCHVF